MKASEARDLSREESKQKVVALVEELFNLRFQHEIGQLENPQKMKQTKREIARLKTIINEKTGKNKAGGK
ncbi:MAG: 50S ribosomal protein L29 [Desulfobacterales bacterium]|jgi:large subunit ribosomal protein L29|nr:50S ribosomal protein L29 [Desulfobacterales bacterium]MDX2508769.1 50S ribosomal protein L29 [Desulfobacterales bacterium]